MTTSVLPLIHIHGRIKHFTLAHHMTEKGEEFAAPHVNFYDPVLFDHMRGAVAGESDGQSNSSNSSSSGDQSAACHDFFR